MFPTTIRQENDDPSDRKNPPRKNQPKKPKLPCDPSAGTNTVQVGTKFDSGFSRYQMHTGCMNLTLRSGGTLSMRFNQFPAQGLGYAGVGPDSWSPAGRGGVFSFLPFIQQEYALGTQSDQGTVDYAAFQGTIGTVSYYKPSTALSLRGKNDTATNLFTVDKDTTGERWIYSNQSSTTVPGRLLKYYDRNGNELAYTYRPRAGNPSGKYHILHKISGDLPQGLNVYFNYGDATNEAAYAHIRRFIVGNGSVGQDRAVYFEWDGSRDTLQRVVYPGGCTTAYDFLPAGSYAQAAIRKEVDQENYTTYFEYTNSSNQVLRKSVEPLSRVTYYNYGTAEANSVRAGRNPTQTQSSFIGGGLQAKTRVVRPDNTPIYYNYDTITSRLMRKIEPNGRATYYRYNSSYALIKEQDVGTGIEVSYSYMGDNQSVRAVVGSRHTVGFPVLTYFEYDSKYNVTLEKNAVNAITRRRFDAIGRLQVEVDPLNKATYYRYDAQVGQLSAVLDARGNSTYFYYNAFAEKTAVVSPRWKELGGMTAFTTAYVSDSRGSIVKMRNPLGQTTYFGYSARGDAVSVQDSRNVAIVVRYDGLRRLAKGAVLGATGTVITATYYKYDAFDNVSKITGPRGFATTMTYDVMDRMTTRTDALGGINYFGYDQIGNHVVGRDAMGRTTRNIFDLLSRKVSMENAIGQRVYYGYDNAGNVIRRRNERGYNRIMTYDPVDRMITASDALGGQTYFAYDLAHNRTQSGDERGRRTRYEYDELSRLILVTNAASQKTYFGYDASGNLILERDRRSYQRVHTYDAIDRRSTTLDPLGGKTYFGYDGIGNLVKMRDPLNRSSVLAYDERNKLIAVTNANSGEAYFGYDRGGNLAKIRNQLGATVLHSYDALDRRTLSMDALGGQTYFGYDAVGNLVALEDARLSLTQMSYDGLNRPVSRTDALGGQTYFGYDQMGNQVKRRDARGNTRLATFDALNRPVTAVDPLGGKTYFGYDAVGNLIKQRNSIGGTSLIAVDVLNRVVSISDPTLAKAYFSYDAQGNRVTSIDPLLRTVSATFDALNRPITVTDPSLATIRLSYDAVGNTRKEVNALGQATYYAYDNLNRLVNVVNPLNVSSYYIYDATSNLTHHSVRAPGIAAAQVKYDILGRKRWFLDGESASGTYFAYDAIGNLVNILDKTGSTTHEYDELNRLSSIVSSRGDATYFGYSATSRLTKVQYPRGTARTNVVYDSLDRVRKLRSPSNRDVYYVYDAASRPMKMKLGGGSSCYYSFDGAHRPTQIRHANAAGASIAQFVYRRDLAGRINRIVRENNLAIYYQYDGADRLTNEAWVRMSTGVSIYGFQYLYDNAGNRTTGVRTGPAGAAIDSTTYVYNAADALIKRWVTPSNQATYYAYNGAGSAQRIIAAAGTTYFEYGRHGLVTKIIPPPATGQPWAFGYDGKLNRTRMVRGDTGKSTYFVWDGLNQLEERDAAGTLIARYIHGRPITPGIGSIVEVQRPSVQLGSQFLHADHQGTVHKVTDAYGRIQIAYTTDAFGRQIVPPTGMTPTMANDIGFQGNWMSVTIGGRKIALSPSRVYDPEIGGFLQKDPLLTVIKVIDRGSGLGIYAGTVLGGAMASAYYDGRKAVVLAPYSNHAIINGSDPSGLTDPISEAAHKAVDYVIDLINKGVNKGIEKGKEAVEKRIEKTLDTISKPTSLVDALDNAAKQVEKALNSATEFLNNEEKQKQIRDLLRKIDDYSGWDTEGQYSGMKKFVDKLDLEKYRDTAKKLRERLDEIKKRQDKSKIPTAPKVDLTANPCKKSGFTYEIPGVNGAADGFVEYVHDDFDSGFRGKIEADTGGVKAEASIYRESLPSGDRMIAEVTGETDWSGKHEEKLTLGVQVGGDGDLETTLKTWFGAKDSFDKFNTGAEAGFFYGLGRGFGVGVTGHGDYDSAGGFTYGGGFGASYNQGNYHFGFGAAAGPTGVGVQFNGGINF